MRSGGNKSINKIRSFSVSGSSSPAVGDGEGIDVDCDRTASSSFAVGELDIEDSIGHS